MRCTRNLSAAALLMAVGGTMASLAVTPPALVNYQGVLKDKASGMPLNATVNAVFTFYPEAGSIGNDILSDAHIGVVVSNGLFSLQLGGGALTDGPGSGTYASLSEVFRDFSDVWLEVRVGTETLSPRVRVAAAAYAMNASQLEGRPASDFLDTSSSYQSKAGTLQVGQLSSNSSFVAYSFNDYLYATTLEMGGDLVLKDGTALLSGRSPQQIATLRWYEASAQSAFAVGSGPYGVAFDGSSIWVANSNSNTVTKLRASDGAVLGTFATGSAPHRVAFDGSSIWVANSSSNSVTKLLASNGSVLGTFPVGTYPEGIAFDGNSIWVANSGSNNVTKLRASDGFNLGTFSVGSNPLDVAYDGSAIWVANYYGNSVTKLRASDGFLFGTAPVGVSPTAVAFDGSSIWVASSGSNTVTKLRASDGVDLGTFSVGSYPADIAFDGSSIWVANRYSHNVTKLRASDGAVRGTFPVGFNPECIAFDGSSIWVTNNLSSTVSKL